MQWGMDETRSSTETDIARNFLSSFRYKSCFIMNVWPSSQSSDKRLAWIEYFKWFVHFQYSSDVFDCWHQHSWHQLQTTWWAASPTQSGASGVNNPQLLRRSMVVSVHPCLTNWVLLYERQTQWDPLFWPPEAWYGAITWHNPDIHRSLSKPYFTSLPLNWTLTMLWTNNINLICLLVKWIRKYYSHEELWRWVIRVTAQARVSACALALYSTGAQ